MADVAALEGQDGGEQEAEKRGQRRIRLTNIKVKKISFVDKPANGEYFVIKKQADDPVEKRIVRRGDEWCVVSEDGKTLGCHPTRDDAVDQLRAVEANKQATAKREEEAVAMGDMEKKEAVGAAQTVTKVLSHEACYAIYNAASGIEYLLLRGEDLPDEVKQAAKMLRDSLGDKVLKRFEKEETEAERNTRDYVSGLAQQVQKAVDALAASGAQIEEVEKVGAKFSKATRQTLEGALKAMRDAIAMMASMLDDGRVDEDEEEKGGGKKKKPMHKEETSKAVLAQAVTLCKGLEGLCDRAGKACALTPEELEEMELEATRKRVAELEARKRERDAQQLVKQLQKMTDQDADEFIAALTPEEAKQVYEVLESARG